MSVLIHPGNKYSKCIAAFTILILVCPYAQNASATLSNILGRTPRIMALGDSITNGSDGGYRKYLAEKLSLDEYAFDFVGSRRSGSFADNDHEGHPSWTPQHLLSGGDNGTGNLEGGVEIWLQENPPDIVLLHAGTNNLNSSNIDYAPLTADWGFHVETMRLIIDEIFTQNPSAYVILAQIIQRRSSPLGLISKFNAQLAVMAGRYEDNPHLSVVNMEGLLSSGTENYRDEFHPSQVGYSKMADAWYPQLKAVLETTAAENIITSTDSNGDGLSDATAIALGLDPDDSDLDTDDDGILDVIEVGSDVNSPLDSDLDGIIDALEPGSVSAYDASIAAGLGLPNGTLATITSVGEILSGVSASVATGGPARVSFSLGTVSYITTSVIAGGSVTTRIIFSTDLPADLKMYKVIEVGAFTLLPTSAWSAIDSRTIEITSTDGDLLTDLDGITNGVIKESIAPGYMLPASGGSPATIGNNNGSGCKLIVATHHDPSIPLIVLISLGYLFREPIKIAVMRTHRLMTTISGRKP